MQGESIIYVAKEWDEVPTSCNHVFEHLAKNNKVLWVNSIGTRNPNLASARDWSRILRKAKKLLGGIKQVAPQGWVYQPVFLPLPHSRLAQRINRWLLRYLLRRQARKLGMKNPQLWMFIPNGAFLVHQLDESLVVYYCTDDWAGFAHLDGGKVARLERQLLEEADLCLAASESLLELKRKVNPNTFLSLHGVDYERFAQALDPNLPIPADIAGLPRPAIGFFGGMRSHIDFPAIEQIAKSHPEWSVVLIGKVEQEIEKDAERLRSYSNVHILGQRPYESLPAYCRGFDAGIIPYRCNEFIGHVNPIKLRQYLSAGLPVVSTDFPEVRRFKELVYLGNTPAEFVACLEQALREDSPARRRERSEAMRAETWEAKVEEIGARVMQAKQNRARTAPRH